MSPVKGLGLEPHETQLWLLKAGLPRIVEAGFSLRIAAVLRFRAKGLVWGDPRNCCLVCRE